MPVTCAKCGEELLGSVNRCWQCGSEMLSTPDAATAPPVRRRPAVPVSAVVAEDTGGEVIQARLADDEAQPEPPVRPTIDSAHRWPRFAAWASVVLGLIALVGGFFSAWWLLAGVVGLAGGIWGMQSGHRTSAAWGMVLCCLGLAVTSSHLAYNLYRWQRGVPVESFSDFDDGFGEFDEYEGYDETWE